MYVLFGGCGNVRWRPTEVESKQKEEEKDQQPVPSWAAGSREGKKVMCTLDPLGFQSSIHTRPPTLPLHLPSCSFFLHSLPTSSQARKVPGFVAGLLKKKTRPQETRFALAAGGSLRSPQVRIRGHVSRISGSVSSWSEVLAQGVQCLRPGWRRKEPVRIPVGTLTSRVFETWGKYSK